MDNYIIQPSNLAGTIAVPPSKSQTMRAILFGTLAQGKSTVRGLLPSDDTNRMIHACQLLGAKMRVTGDVLEIEGVDGKVGKVKEMIHVGNSGIMLRCLAAVTALSHSFVAITGDESICNHRPMLPMLDALTQLDVFAVSSKSTGHAPVIINGPLKGGKASFSGEDSQFVSALLIACSFAEGPTELIVSNPGEKPWVMLTLNWMDRLGIKYKNDNFEHYYIEGRSHCKGFDFTVPGDWSSAAFPIVAALVTGSSLTIENLGINDSQGDKEIVNVLKAMGAEIEIKPKSVQVKGGKLKGVTVDANDFIDAVVILAVVACFAEGETRITNVAVARQKECDRLQSTAMELGKMGAKITELPDGLVIQGAPLHGAIVDSHGDHRLAMALAVAGMGAKGETTVQNVSCVDKTFPNFAESFKAIGAKI